MPVRLDRIVQGRFIPRNGAALLAAKDDLESLLAFLFQSDGSHHAPALRPTVARLLSIDVEGM